MYHWSRTEIVLVFFTVTQPHRRSGPGARREQGKPPNATQRDETRIAQVACRRGDKQRARKNRTPRTRRRCGDGGATRRGGKNTATEGPGYPTGAARADARTDKGRTEEPPFCGHRRARATPAAAGETPDPSRQTEPRQRPAQGGGHARTGNGARPDTGHGEPFEHKKRAHAAPGRAPRQRGTPQSRRPGPGAKKKNRNPGGGGGSAARLRSADPETPPVTPVAPAPGLGGADKRQGPTTNSLRFFLVHLRCRPLSICAAKLIFCE